ncbi:Uu.00g057040.m01.CDS01 [Anthostomella pinea]|uniref:Uu.00g057040.m01.CDS01 n=1 Tax=Anthostomella pinea TaxID=933095 RepID=A0AAI8VS94_9PEZI|nr:Uu.00g057040.m01.CDS01 [Anthostomella pinea]
MQDPATHKEREKICNHCVMYCIRQIDICYGGPFGVRTGLVEQRRPREEALARIDNIEENDDVDDVPLMSEGTAADATISRDVRQSIVLDGEGEGHEEIPLIHQAPEAMISRGFGETIILDEEEVFVPKEQPTVAAQHRSKDQDWYDQQW